MPPIKPASARGLSEATGETINVAANGGRVLFTRDVANIVTDLNDVEVVRFAALPQVLANFVSYALLRFEINVRQASVLGFVGAGGIGQDLIEAIRKFYYNDVAALLMLIIATVVAIDLATERKL